MKARVVDGKLLVENFGAEARRVPELEFTITARRPDLVWRQRTEMTDDGAAYVCGWYLENGATYVAVAWEAEYSRRIKQLQVQDQNS